MMDKRGHAIFLRVEDGIRAAFCTLSKKSRNGKNTLRAICADWAPKNDTVGSIPGGKQNDPIAYAQYVSDWLQVGIDSPLDLFEKNGRINNLDDAVTLFYGMSSYESPKWAIPQSAVLRGIADYLSDKVEGQSA